MTSLAPFLLAMMFGTCSSAFGNTATDICECLIKAKVIGEMQNTDRKYEFVLKFDDACKHPFPLAIKILVKKDDSRNNFNTTTNCRMIKKECNVSLMDFKYESDTKYNIHVLLADCCSHCPPLKFAVTTPYEPTTTLPTPAPLRMKEDSKTTTLAKAVGIGFVAFVVLIIVSSVILFICRRNHHNIPTKNDEQALSVLLQHNERPTGGIFIASFPRPWPQEMDVLTENICKLEEKFRLKNINVEVLQKIDLNSQISIDKYLGECDAVILIFDDCLWNIWKDNPQWNNNTYDRNIRYMLKQIEQMNDQNSITLYLVNATTEYHHTKEYAESRGISVMYSLSKEEDITTLVSRFN